MERLLLTRKPTSYTIQCQRKGVDPLLALIYLAATVAANLLVNRFGPSSIYLVGFLFIGLDLTVRDLIHDRWTRDGRLRFRMAGLILLGSLLTLLINWMAWRVAVASAAAFLAAGAADSITYHLARKWGWLHRVTASNYVSASVDSFLFPTIAFGAFMPWVSCAQLCCKLVGGMLWALLILRLRARLGGVVESVRCFREDMSDTVISWWRVRHPDGPPISLEEVKRREAAEDAWDNAEADAAIAEGGPMIPWEDVKRDLGITTKEDDDD